MDPIHTSITEYNDSIFVINVPRIKFGVNSTKETGYEAKSLNIKNAMVFAGKKLSESRQMETLINSLNENNINYKIIDEIRVEPEDTAWLDTYKKIKDEKIDGFISLGGGSTIDTAKIMDLLYTYKGNLEDYINKPIGKGISPPGPLKPHIAIPTTAGTGSETTNVAIFDVTKIKVKTGISNPYLRPTIAIIDPVNTYSLPQSVTASSGLDVLNHAIESYTAIPYTGRQKVNPGDRPVYTGNTPIGDLFAKEAIKWVHTYMKRAYSDPYDSEARYYMMLGSSIAGMGFGHVGVHIPHAMGYPIAGMIKEWHPDDYDFGYPIVPHGIGTAIPAAYVFRYLSKYSDRFKDISSILGIESGDTGDALFEYYIKLLKALKIPTNLSDIGFSDKNVEDLVNGTLKQQRLISLSPKMLDKKELTEIFKECIG
ncbi:alcohol dehydrogenase IV [Ferroplasma acidiphilum]|uniref:hydroxyacid-oxoacid transhydrogenase n=1 Tax=Ferroplasma acidiphilum TaxID=74969 RepID=A0A1V0N444_9ARCH|nr:hydroxyacid-oxoacid transhydrogenase [Ferroplasma acidiphilum]ARD84865.1 alcohol dehydrogenase IV [Ferroplasma acidiphilum]